MIKNQALGRSNKALIFLGLFLGLVSAVLVVVYLSQASDDGGGDVSGGPLTPVVVATQDISPGQRISQEMIALKDISSDAILADAFREIDPVVGQVARVPLVAGEQVIPAKVTATGAAITDVENPPLAYVVPEGMRAVSVQITNIIGASGLIRPGDYVDVVLTVKVQGQAANPDTNTTDVAYQDQIAATILENVQVLSIDQDVALTSLSEDSGDGAVAADEGGDVNPNAATVTLAVAPVHGEVLTVAETCGQNFDGRLAIALRGFGDSSDVAPRATWASDGPVPTCAALLGLTTLQ